MKDKLRSWLEVETDEKALSLIRELISVYEELDTERSKNSRIVDLIHKRNQTIKALNETIANHATEREAMNDMLRAFDAGAKKSTESFRQMFWLANYSKSPLFSSKLLLKLWEEVEALFKSKTTNEAEELQAKIVVTLSELESDELMVDARNSVLFYEKYNSEQKKPDLLEDLDLEEIISEDMRNA